ncbi:uncharacterized protein LOC131041946 isoform X2 [Cryptomeria japonica]|nr:uncharacterized protein LOC131041946 isoform X2 [Cryptomeria japonica]
MGKGEQKKEDALDISPSRPLREGGKAIANLSELAYTSTIKKMQHLQKLAVWASGEGSIPSIGALLGTHLADAGEISRIPLPDSPFFTCERCEMILQPGLNCFVRVWKHPRKARHKPRSFSKLANAVVYTCNFCSHKNIKPGTPEGYLKKGKAQKALNAIQSAPIEKNFFKKADRRNVMSSMSISSPSPGSTPITPTSANLSSTKKRKRKTRSTLQELTNSNQKLPSFSNLSALKIHSFSL